MTAAHSIVLVVAAADNGVIGRDGGMPWRLPDDLAHFKSVTMGHPIIMGRKTWEELNCTPLPGRRNIVLTRAERVDGEGCTVASSPDVALAIAGDGEVMVIGGGEIYRSFLPQAHVIELTRVHADIEGDTTFPALDQCWTLASSQRHDADERHAHAFTFERWTRISDAST